MSQTISVKRQIAVKTIVSENFKLRAVDELNQEIKLIDNQINHMQVQLNQLIQQLQQGTSSGLSVSPREAEQIINDLNMRLQQLINLKQGMQKQIENINHTNLGDLIATGSLESYVDIAIGDNIYDKLLDREIIIKDGVVQEIKS